jgi:drug/metabolite transporter (DMT)-like permease
VRHRVPADALLVAVTVVWSFNFTVTKYAFEHGWDPLAFAAVRYTAAALIFCFVTLRLEGSLRFRRADWLTLGVVAAFGTGLNQLSINYGLDLTTASTAALVFGTLPIVVGSISFAFGVERPSRRHWLATCVSCGGVALVALGAGGGLSGDLGGILCVLGAVVTFASFSVAVAPLNRNYSPYRLSALVASGAAIMLLAAGAPQLAHEDWSSIPPLAWGALAITCIVGFVITNVLWITAIDRVGATRASIYVNLQPFLGALFAVLLLSEHLAGLQIAGGLVIGAGILLSRRWRAPRTPPPE